MKDVFLWKYLSFFVIITSKIKSSIEELFFGVVDSII